jgi:hypothetical protein
MVFCQILWPEEGVDVISLTVDGVKLTINEPKEFPSPRWLDPKSSSAGLMHELAASIRTNNVVSINDPFQPTKGNGQAYKEGLHEKVLEKRQKVIADNAYRSQSTMITKTSTTIKTQRGS